MIVCDFLCSKRNNVTLGHVRTNTTAHMKTRRFKQQSDLRPSSCPLFSDRERPFRRGSRILSPPTLRHSVRRRTDAAEEPFQEQPS